MTFGDAMHNKEAQVDHGLTWYLLGSVKIWDVGGRDSVSNGLSRDKHELLAQCPNGIHPPSLKHRHFVAKIFKFFWFFVRYAFFWIFSVRFFCELLPALHRFQKCSVLWRECDQGTKGRRNFAHRNWKTGIRVTRIHTSKMTCFVYALWFKNDVQYLCKTAGEVQRKT